MSVLYAIGAGLLLTVSPLLLAFVIVLFYHVLRGGTKR